MAEQIAFLNIIIFKYPTLPSGRKNKVLVVMLDTLKGEFSHLAQIAAKNINETFMLTEKKWQFSSKVKILVKVKCPAKIEMLVKNLNFGKKSKF